MGYLKMRKCLWSISIYRDVWGCLFEEEFIMFVLVKVFIYEFIVKNYEVVILNSLMWLY